MLRTVSDADGLEQSMRFEKWHGLGNDFIVVHEQFEWWRTHATSLCDRHRGIGADGVLFVTEGPSPSMHIINADGSEPEMCGNGLRCVVGWLAERAGVASLSTVLRTPAGPLDVVGTADGQSWTVRSSLGVPVFGGDAVGATSSATSLDADGLGPGMLVSMGNPHWVFLDAPGLSVLRARGADLERDARFTARTNVEFVESLGSGTYRVDVWERGCGLTQACGTGAAAVAAVLFDSGREAPGATITLELPGGPLRAHRRDEDGAMMVSGPAVRVYAGAVSR